MSPDLEDLIETARDAYFGSRDAQEQFHRVLSSAPALCALPFVERAYDWHHAPRKSFDLSRPCSNTDTVPFIQTCDPCGYVRQRALQKLHGVPGPFALGLVIVRLNDWATPVRTAASEALQRLAENITDATLYSSYDLFLSSSDWGRMTPEGRNQLTALFDRLPPGEIVSGLIARSDDAAATNLRILLRRNRYDAFLPQIAYQAAHSGVRLIAKRALLLRTFSWSGPRTGQRTLMVPDTIREQVMRAALRDASPAIRLIGLDTYGETAAKRADARATISPLLFDKSLRVAKSAYYWLANVGGDGSGLIRERLARGEHVPASALTLLGRHGTAADAAMLLTTAARLSERNRWAAVTAAARLAPDAALPLILDIASTEALPQSRYAVRSLLELGETLDLDSLTLAAQWPATFFVRDLHVMTKRIAPWRAAIVAMTLSHHGGGPASLGLIRSIARRSYRQWSPSPAEQARLRALTRSANSDAKSALGQLVWLINRER